MPDPLSAELLAGCRMDDPAAAEMVVRRYADRLIGLARSRLSQAFAARVDPQDVVQSAFRSFFLLARGGDLEVQESGDLWRLLAHIAVRKVYRTVRRHRAEIRAISRETDWTAEVEAELRGKDPTPADAAALIDELRGVLAPLTPLQRRIVELRLQGCEIDDIARDVDRSPRTVRRALAAVGAEMERRLIEPNTTASATISFADVTLLRQIGAGGMGKVYKACWRDHDGFFAIKLLRRTLRRSPAMAERFRQEADVLRKLRHPGIVAVHGVGVLPDGGAFVVMDLVEGTDLSRHAPVDHVVACRWIIQAADAVHHANRMGIIHCDLKPSNLLLGRDGCVHLTDFGLARSMSDHDAGVQGGTAGFLAPEQLEADAMVSPATDVYGLGGVLRSLIPDPTPAIDAVIRRCLQPNAGNRFETAAELADALHGAIE